MVGCIDSISIDEVDFRHRRVHFQSVGKRRCALGADSIFSEMILVVVVVIIVPIVPIFVAAATRQLLAVIVVTIIDAARRGKLQCDRAHAVFVDDAVVVVASIVTRRRVAAHECLSATHHRRCQLSQASSHGSIKILPKLFFICNKTPNNLSPALQVTETRAQQHIHQHQVFLLQTKIAERQQQQQAEWCGGTARQQRPLHRLQQPRHNNSTTKTTLSKSTIRGTCARSRLRPGSDWDRCAADGDDDGFERWDVDIDENDDRFADIDDDADVVELDDDISRHDWIDCDYGWCSFSWADGYN
jgi:hypothetical protein